jgi:hypothetical protein
MWRVYNIQSSSTRRKRKIKDNWEERNVKLKMAQSL